MSEFQKRLRPGEKVLWQGAPQPFALLEDGYRTAIIRRWVIMAVCAAAILLLYLRTNSAPSAGFIVLVLLLAAVVMASPFLERRHLSRQEYWITDQRVFVKTSNGALAYMELSEIGEPLVIGAQNTAPSLALGSEIHDTVEKQVRWQACHPKISSAANGNQEHAVGLVLYEIARPGEALELLRSGKAAKAS